MNKELKRKIVEISYKHKLSHLGSCLSAVDIIADIYQEKRPDEKFILSEGHAGLALYVVLEKHGIAWAERLLEEHGIHPSRDEKNGLYCSTGSLGQGLPIAVGMAMADRHKNVYCLISDGECAEGSVWEALRIAEEQQLRNLKVYVNMNGWSAYDPIDTTRLTRRLKDFELDIRIYNTRLPEMTLLWGLAAHYIVLSEDLYKEAMESYK